MASRWPRSVSGSSIERGFGVNPDPHRAFNLYLAAALENDPIAERLLALAFSEGIGTTRNKAEEVAWLKRSAQHGDADAMYLLSEIYAEGHGAALDKEAARKYLLDAAEHGHALSAARIGIEYTATSDPARAAKWLENAIDRATKQADFLPEDSTTYRGRELALARYHLAMLLIDGNGVKQDVVRAVALLHYAAEHDCALATNQLARMYHQAFGVVRDDAKAARLYEAAAAAGIGSAAFDLANGYTTGWVGERSGATALRWYRRAAALGFPAAWFALGRVYEEASGAARDNSEALTWYQLAGNNNVAAAQLRLGDVARFGELDQPRDDQVALRWYRLAADHGQGIAEEKIGDLYWQGSAELPRDRVEAVRHYNIAANQGIASAERKLAIAYANGDGAHADDAQMLRWDRKAAEAGDAVAAGLLGYAIMIGLDGTYDLVEAATWLTLAAESAHPGEWRMQAAAYSQDAQSKLTASEREAFRARLARRRSERDGE